MADVLTILAALATYSPTLLLLALIATGLGWIIYQQRQQQKGQDQIAQNHLHGLPEMAESLKRIEEKLDKLNDGIIYIKARINGKP